MTTTYLQAMVLLFVLLTPSTVLAGKVEGLVTFQPNTPAKASEVNSNFTAVKTAVDDNDTEQTARLDAIETGKQNRVTGTCPDNSAVRSVAGDGSVSCESFQKEGVLSVSPTGFQVLYDSSQAMCGYVHGQIGFFTGTETSGCQAAIGVTLPNNVVLTRLRCTTRDTQAGAARITRVALYRSSLTEGWTGQTILATEATIDTTEVQFLSDDTATTGTERIDNSQYVYALSMSAESDGIPFDSIGANLRLIGCQIYYAP